MPLPQKLTKYTTASPAIVTFDAEDFADGTSVVILKGSTTKADTTTSYVLQKTDNFSNDIETKVIGMTTSFTKLMNLDFDLTPMELSRTAKGTAVINVTLAMQSTAASATCNGYIIANIKHVDAASAETNLGTAMSETITSPASAGGIKAKTVQIKIALTEKHFAQGETLRLTIEGWGKRNAGDNTQNIFIGHDPQNRDGTTGINPSTDDPATTTNLNLNMPFETI